MIDYHGIIDIGDQYKNDELVKVYDSNGVIYEDAIKFDQYIDLNTANFIKGCYYNIVLKRTTVKHIDVIELEPCGANYYRVPGIVSRRLNIEGIYYTAPADVISIESVIDENNEEFPVELFRLDMAYIPPKIVEDQEVYPVGKLTATNVKYIEPFTFAVLNQNLDKADIAQMEASHGDAVVSFPYSCDVAENDVLTVLAGTTTSKSLIVRTRNVYDVIPAFFVESIVKITGKTKDYEQGVDYILAGCNGIKWISNNAPAVGEGYSVVYKIYPTYSVIKDIPQLRSSENQRFPKKAVVQFMSSYSEKRGINKQ